MKISEILHEAADVYLWDGIEDDHDKQLYSCDAINTATENTQTLLKIKSGLKEMGLNTETFSEFKEFPYGEQRQSARYTWLKFAAMIAEEQGV